MKLIKRPIAVRVDARQVDEQDDLWDLYYEEDVKDEDIELAKKTVELMKVILPARIEGNTLIIDMKGVERSVAWDSIAGEFLLQSTMSDFTFTIGDMLGATIASRIQNEPEHFDGIYDSAMVEVEEVETVEPEKKDKDE